MSTIEVVVQGIIMFVAATVYDGTGTGTGAAIAVRAATAVPGKYGVELPSHEPRLRVKKLAIDGDCPAPFAEKGDDCRLDLTGYRIELGNYEVDKCKPLAGAGATGDMEGVPELTDIKTLTSTKLIGRARPQGGGGSDYKNIDPNLVAGWLNISQGDLQSKQSRLSGEAEFRPSLNRYRPARDAKWVVEDVDAACLQVTPFGGAPAVVRFRDVPEIQIQYVNLPTVVEGHVHGRRGASYDFELFYKILESQPDIPPVPHYLQEVPEVTAGDEPRLIRWMSECVAACLPQISVDPSTGENCGPGKNNKP
jgi:hypothetical protein